MQRPVADHRARPVVEVQHRREAEVDTVRAELRGDDVGGAPRRLRRHLPVPIPQPSELAHGRDRGKTLAEALYPATLVVDANQERWVT